MRGSLVAVGVDPHRRYAVLVRAEDGASATVVAEGELEHVAARMIDLERREAPRWVWWRAGEAAALIRAGGPLRRAHDAVEVHRLLAGGHDDRLDAVWAAAHRLPLEELPARRTGDLFDLDPVDDPVLASGYLNPAVLEDSWREDRQNLARWCRLVLRVAAHQRAALSERERAPATAASESGAAMLCVELEDGGLPVDRERLETMIADLAGPRPRSDDDATRERRRRDEQVLRHAPGYERTDLRHPADVIRMLHGVGVRVDDTRAAHLEPYRHTYPVVEALLTWRKAERIATTYGWAWIDRHLGRDGRLRGTWSASDGGAGRMTAGAGLHSLPTPLREAVCAEPGFRLVRADLGQVEPRVLAVVSGDRDLARATVSDDLYAQVAAALGIDRPTAKIAMLAAMYGQTSGPAAQVLERMQRSYPVAIRYLDEAARRGERGEDLMTYGGRLVPGRAGGDPAARRAHGRFTRNAVVQGAAAELFKAWALTARADLLALDARIVLCLHDELLVHAPREAADEAAQALRHTLAAASWHWSGGSPVRFVADVSVVDRWSQCKD